MLPFIGTRLPLNELPDYNPAVLRSPYTTAWCGAYDGNSRMEGSGSHPGVDIGVRSQPVFAVSNGEIVAASHSPYGFGNHVVLKMENVPEYGTLFACYAHLQSLNVAVGDLVFAGEPVGITGNTGASTGPHLHFQIDHASSAFHPYWPFTANDLQQRGLTNWEAINRGIASNKVRKYTLSPLVFLQKYRDFQPPTFVDTSNLPAEKAIRQLQIAGVLSGTTATKFKPNAALNRAAAVKIALFSTGKRVNLQVTTTQFFDVKPTDWFAPFVSAAVKVHAVTGNPDGSFRPHQPVAHAEFLKILAISANLPIPKSGRTRFVDVPETAWFAPFFAAAEAAGWLAKLPSNAAPTQPLTRAATAELAANALVMR